MEVDTKTLLANIEKYSGLCLDPRLEEKEKDFYCRQERRLVELHRQVVQNLFKKNDLEIMDLNKRLYDVNNKLQLLDSQNMAFEQALQTITRAAGALDGLLQVLLV